MPPDLIDLPIGAVDTAIGQLRRMASHLDGVGSAVDTAATAARVDWSGGHRDDFDVFLPGLVQRHGDLATQLRNLIGDLEDAKAAVARENRRRTDAWEAQQAQPACRPGQPC